MALRPQLAGRVVGHAVEEADGVERHRIGLVEDGVVVEQPLLATSDGPGRCPI
jgi:hypothetical protein